ncbi:hypothetical protein F4810DRAFT_705326 [Camillea tinctor]|nr:hypothetical protein F4810DRAFT_705326 [Camillea tinctor]
MAPPSTTAAIIFDYRTQVLDNCEFFVGRDDIVSVITVKDGTGNYKAFAIRSNDSSREALLSSDSFDTVHKAIESLHNKSSEAVHQYIMTNGFSNPPDLTKAGACLDDDDDTTSETTRRSSSSTAAASEEEWNSSDDEAMMTGNAARNQHGNHKGVHSPNRKDRKPIVGEKPRRPRSRSSTRTGQDESDDESPLMPGGFGYFGPIRPSPNAYRPPPPPPGWPGVPSSMVRNMPAPPHFQQQPLPQPPSNHPRPPPPPNFANTPRYTQVGVNPGSVRVPCPAPAQAPAAHLPIPTPPTAMAHTSSANTSPTPTTTSLTATPSPGPFPPSPSSPASAQRLYDVRLTIRWLHHGEQRIIENLRPSLRALQEAALRYVRTHPSSFHGSGSQPQQGTPSMSCLRSCVRQAFFGNESYDMSTYRSDDLSKLFAALSSNGIPRFEIDVDFIGVPVLPGTMGRGEK